MKQAKVKPLLVDYRDLECGVEGERLGNLDYEDFIAGGDPEFAWEMPSRRMGRHLPQLYQRHHRQPQGRRLSPSRRGADVLRRTASPPAWASIPVYLWTLPMFHCNGWCFPWSISLLSGTHVCLRAVRAKPMYDAIADHKVTHLSGAPFVMSALLNATDDERRLFRAARRLQPCRRPAAGRRARQDGRVRLRAHPSLRPDRDLRPGHAQRMARRLGRASHRRAARQAHPPGRALSRARRFDGDGPRHHGEGARRRRDARRGHVPRQYRDEGLSQQREGDRRRRSPAAGSIPAISA